MLSINCGGLRPDASGSRKLRYAAPQRAAQPDPTPMNYSAFLASKSTACPPVGFDPAPFTAPLFPFQRDIVTMACRVGRFCIWADCGMGKCAVKNLTNVQAAKQAELLPCS